jgi:predicted ATPase
VHLQIAHILETQLPDTVETQPELLAHHYTEAGHSAQALLYWQRAGQRAKERSAHVEAIGHLAKGLAVLETLPESAERRQQELELQIERGLSLIVIRGQAAPEVGQAYTRARQLCEHVEDRTQRFRVLWGLWHFHVVRAELRTVQELGEQLLSVAHSMNDPAYLVGGHFVMAGGLTCIGEFASARAHWQQGIALHAACHPQGHVSLYGSDIGVFSLSWGAHTLWHLGYADEALAMSHRALALAQDLSHPYSLALALAYAAMLHQFRREPDAVGERAAAAMALCVEHKFAYYMAWATLLQGWALAESADQEGGMQQMQQGLEALLATGASIRKPYYLTLLAEAYGKSGRAKDGLVLLHEALMIARETGELWREAELHRLQGELLLMLAVPDPSQAECCFHQALTMARRQDARALELRAAMSVSRLWQQHDRHDDARTVLADVLPWFTEGLDTPDLQDARTLLQAPG